ncbi:MAG: DEAD/DEAH box helicase family protein, partial [Lachnospiraceae bacterium]|nr:DEAD/DEAH box helicase family protein [Lachnospiraceae bacterium]
MNAKERQGAQLQFLFTAEGFLVDPSVQDLNPKHQRLKERFEKDKYGALYQAGLEEKPEDLSASAFFLFLVADTFFQVLTSLPELEVAREEAKAEPSEEVSQQLLDAVPFVIGSEHLTKKWIQRIFGKLTDIFREEIRSCDGTVAMYLAEKSQHLKVPERIFFHLVESKEEAYPFAFLATYATRSENGRIRHMPLEYALTEYKNQREKLLGLLSCLNQAAEVSELISGFMESGELFHPLRLTSGEAYEFLKQTEEIERTGILCRIPNWWKKKAASVSMSVRLGEEQPAMLGFDTLVSIRPRLTVDGQSLTEEDIRSLLAQTEGLAFLKGKWVEVDHEKLKKLLEEMEKNEGEMTLMEALRLELGTAEGQEESGPVVTNGTWLSSLLMSLRNPGRIRKLSSPKSFRATLRPYQKNGYTWLNYMNQLGFGACLADDMGLGKTVQVLAYLERLRTKEKHARVLLIVPASLVGNWQKEAQKFAPSMELLVLHGKTSAVLEQMLAEHPAFLTVTTYGMASRISALQEIPWTAVILDEAQAIKNPSTRQTKEIKKLSAGMRIAMTGT